MHSMVSSGLSRHPRWSQWSYVLFVSCHKPSIFLVVPFPGICPQHPTDSPSTHLLLGIHSLLLSDGCVSIVHYLPTTTWSSSNMPKLRFIFLSLCLLYQPLILLSVGMGLLVLYLVFPCDLNFHILSTSKRLSHLHDSSILYFSLSLSVFANCRSQFLLDRLTDVSNCSYRLTVHPLTSSRLSSA